MGSLATATAIALLAGSVLAGCGDGSSTPAIPTTTTTTTTATTAGPSPSSGPAPPSTSPAPGAPSPFAGLGAWVDVFDYVPAFAGDPPSVSPTDVAAMADAGVRTLYVQTGRDDPRSPGALAHPRLLAELVGAAHDAGVQVVGWYLPTHVDPDNDAARVRAIATFREGGGFDAIALDIEWIDGVTDVDERNRRLVDLTREAEQAGGDRPLGAIVFPPVVLDELNPALWPGFPWGDLAPHVDAWLPMAYWTFREPTSPHRDPFAYTTANIDRLRFHVGDAPIHVIGGVADRFLADDIGGFVDAVAARAPLGWSVYDWSTLSAEGRRALAAVP